jgi:hypothetical protein
MIHSFWRDRGWLAPAFISPGLLPRARKTQDYYAEAETAPTASLYSSEWGPQDEGMWV